MVRDGCCDHALGRSEFRKKVQRELREEAEALCGGIECLICGNWDEAYLEFHHIRPWIEGGTSTTNNGAILCANCHRRAHNGVVLPVELTLRKEGVTLWRTPITRRSRIEELLHSAPVVEGREIGSLDKTIRTSAQTLAKLRNCHTVNQLLREEIHRARARFQLRMAGALTSREPAGVPRRESSRYIIALLAASARRTAIRPLDDLFLRFQAVHSLATNAVAVGHLPQALRRSRDLYRLLRRVERKQTAYAAYTARNIASIAQRGHEDDFADELIEESRRLAGDDPELLVRHAEVLAMRCNLPGAEKLLEYRRGLRTPNEPIHEVITLRVSGLSECLAESFGHGLGLLESAAVLAAKHLLGHQQHKIEVALSCLRSRKYRLCIAGLRKGKARQRLPKALLDLF